MNMKYPSVIVGLFLFGAVFFGILNMNAEAISGIDIETDEVHTIELSDMNHGEVLDYSWDTDDSHDKVNFWIEDPSENIYEEATRVEAGSGTFTIPSSGTYKMFWMNDNFMDTVTLFITYDVSAPPAVDDLDLTVDGSFSENPCHQGNTTILTVEVKNENEDQIKVLSIGAHFDIFPAELYETESGIDEIIATGQTFYVDLEITVNTDVSLGTHIYDIYITYEGRVLGNWYPTDWQGEDQTDFEVMEIDRDFDGHPDSIDSFPDNPDEWKDTDSDSVGDNSDDFPSDPAASRDDDGDTYPDQWNLGKTEIDSTTGLSLDKFPDDPAAWKDDDEDGYPDVWVSGMTKNDSTSGLELDAFPDDAAASNDEDGDSYPDEWNTGSTEADSTTGLVLDAFPGNSSEWLDTDGDGVGNNTDAFPEDPAASLDTDGDGYPDVWNTGMTKDNSTTDLGIDAYPEDATRWEKEEDSSFIAIFSLIGAVVLVGVLIGRKK